MSAPGERGNVGEPPVSLTREPEGGPGDHTPWRDPGSVPRGPAPVREPTNPESTPGIGKRATREATREGQRAVGAASRTDEGGEGRPKRPTGGKAPSGRAA